MSTFTHCLNCRLTCVFAILGALFEHLVALSVHTYAETAEGRVSHLRTRNNIHEVDLIVQHADGRVLGIEVKLADRVEDADTQAPALAP